MAKLIAVHAETNHHNNDGVAWYAYYEGEPELVFETDEAMTAFKAEIEEAAKKDGAPMGFDWDSWEEGDQGQDEVPSILSERAGLRRYYIGQAC